MTAVAVACVLVALYGYTPADAPRWRLCPFHWLTGLDCPLCGLTRAFFALAKGRWREAMGFNALAPLGAVMLAAAFRQRPWLGRLWTGGVAAFAIYGVIRNWS